MPEIDEVLHRLRRKAEAEPPMAPSVADVRALHAEHQTRYGKLARQSTRTEVHGILQILRPIPTEVPTGGPYRAGDLDMVQKHHGMDLWRDADAMVDEALGQEARR